MGAQFFTTYQNGQSAREAFRDAVEDARWEHGHGGYTGTIAEKHDAVQITLPEGMDPEQYAYQLMDNSDERIDDKWGPAGYFYLGQVDPDDASKGNRYLFFGWASS